MTVHIPTLGSERPGSERMIFITRTVLELTPTACRTETNALSRSPKSFCCT